MFARGSTSAAGSNAARVKNEVNIPNGLGGAAKNLKYHHRLNFYEKPPTEEITIEDFEVWAIDRLRGASLLPCLLVLYSVTYMRSITL